MILRNTSPLLLSLALLFAGCSTTDSRIQENEAAFQALSPAQQEKIRAGDVEVGYTQEMVRMALGAPDRSYTRTTDQGTVEVWAYRSKAPAVSFGFGVAGGGGGSGMGAGIGVTTGGDRSDDRLRVVIEAGRVTAIERAGKK